MKDADAAALALRHYKTLWYGQTWGSPLAALWQTEYDAVAGGTFTPLQIISTGFDGGTAQAQKNFEQGLRLAALQQFRAALDADYAAAVFDASPALPTSPTVTYPLFGPACFPH